MAFTLGESLKNRIGAPGLRQCAVPRREVTSVSGGVWRCIAFAAPTTTISRCWRQNCLVAEVLSASGIHASRATALSRVQLTSRQPAGRSGDKDRSCSRRMSSAVKSHRPAPGSAPDAYPAQRSFVGRQSDPDIVNVDNVRQSSAKWYRAGLRQWDHEARARHADRE